MVGERSAGVGEGRVGLSSPGPLFLSDPHSGSFSMWHLWGHGESLMAPRSHKCASSPSLCPEPGWKGEDGKGRDGIINKEMKQDKHIIVDWRWENTLTWEGKKQKAGGKKKTNLPEEGASTSMWDLRKACVYLKWWPGSTAYSHGHSCLGIKRNMRKRQRGVGAGAVKRLEKGSVTPTAESVLIAGGGDHRGNPLEHHWVKLIVDINIFLSSLNLT